MTPEQKKALRELHDNLEEFLGKMKGALDNLEPTKNGEEFIQLMNELSDAHNDYMDALQEQVDPTGEIEIPFEGKRYDSSGGYEVCFNPDKE